MKNKAAIKKDSGKPRFDLLSPYFLKGIAKVMTHTAESGKYDDRNWEAGLKWHRLFSSCMRHLWDWWLGEELDPESGLSHLFHAGCCIMMLAHYADTKRYGSFDDRPHLPEEETPDPAKPVYFGEGCCYLTEQLDNNGDVAISHCTNVENNDSEHEGNCTYSNCPLITKGQ